MKTTIDIPDSFYPRLMAMSSAEGLSLEEFVLRAVSEKASNGPSSQTPQKSVASFFVEQDRLPDEQRRAIQDASVEIDAIVEAEFSRIDHEGWE